MQSDVLLEIKDLHVEFSTREGTVQAVNGMNLTVHRGETVGLVGESGCGKSVTARAILGLVPSPGKVTGGKVYYYPPNSSNAGTHPGPGIELTALHPESERMRGVRWREIAMIFQEPMTSFSPVHTIGNQIAEVVRLHQGVGKKAAWDRTVEMLDVVGIPNARRRAHAYPFELSGGMRQRAMIAMALSCNPSLLIADEPTTAIDVTIQAQILDLLKSLQAEFGMAILIITHNLGIVASMAHRVSVMYMGKVIESAHMTELFDSPKHPYTLGLLQSVPPIDGERVTRLSTIKGNVPNPYLRVPGCTFHPRCPDFMPGVCDVSEPKPITVGIDHEASCFLYSPNSESPALEAAGGDLDDE